MTHLDMTPEENALHEERHRFPESYDYLGEVTLWKSLRRVTFRNTLHVLRLCIVCLFRGHIWNWRYYHDAPGTKRGGPYGRTSVNVDCQRCGAFRKWKEIGRANWYGEYIYKHHAATCRLVNGHNIVTNLDLVVGRRSDSNRNNLWTVPTPTEILYKPYTRIFNEEPGGTGFSARIAEFPGCFSGGDTIEEARINLERAAESWIEACQESGRPIPEPTKRTE